MKIIKLVIFERITPQQAIHVQLSKSHNSEDRLLEQIASSQLWAGMPNKWDIVGHIAVKWLVLSTSILILRYS